VPFEKKEEKTMIKIQNGRHISTKKRDKIREKNPTVNAILHKLVIFAVY